MMVLQAAVAKLLDESMTTGTLIEGWRAANKPTANVDRAIGDLEEVLARWHQLHPELGVGIGGC